MYLIMRTSTWRKLCPYFVWFLSFSSLLLYFTFDHKIAIISFEPSSNSIQQQIGQQKLQQISNHRQQKGQGELYSMCNIPKFCSDLRSPKTILPILTPSNTLFILNEKGASGTIEQDDKSIVNYLWEHCDIFLRPPIGTPSTYAGPNPSMGQDAIVRKILGNLSGGGFYVECGALDGILSSNTLIFEKQFGWNGLLIEPDPLNLAKLYQEHRRNAWISHACLSLKPYPHQAIFTPSFDLGRISQVLNLTEDLNSIMEALQERIVVQCFPLYSFVYALNVTVIDYFSLDIEGDELAVLQTIPFDKLLIKVISVEFLTSQTGENALKQFMESKGYQTVAKFYSPYDQLPFDLIFAHKSVEIEEELREELAIGL